MSKENQPQQRPEADYFRQPLTPAQRQYEALRAYFLEGLPVCDDPGFALFAALNVLPKTTALSTYSYRITRAMILSLLYSYHQALQQGGLLRGECFNLDFHAIPQRGEEAVLEKHYVSKRSRRERAVWVFLAQDSDTRVLC